MRHPEPQGTLPKFAYQTETEQKHQIYEPDPEFSRQATEDTSVARMSSEADATKSWIQEPELGLSSFFFVWRHVKAW